MQLSTVLTPESDENLRLAAQCGVTHVVSRYPGPTLDDLRRRQKHFAGFDLKLSVIEGYLPIENIKIGCDDGTEMVALKQLIRNMGEAGVPILCYNFMAGTPRSGAEHASRPLTWSMHSRLCCWATMAMP